MFPLAQFRKQVTNAFLRYVRINTQSDPRSVSTPSTASQLDLARILQKEIQVFNLPTELNTCLLVRIKGNVTGVPPLAILAHLDTAQEVTGKNVTPQVWENYDGNPIPIGNGYTLEADSTLLQYKGDTIITTDGSTLLGADDKAGVAEIMTMLQYLVDNPEYPHGDIEVIFNPDEEIGRGTDGIDLNALQAKYAVTVDGGGEGGVFTSCFNAYGLVIEFQGKAIHPGSARKQLINATAMAGRFLTMLPALESPEATDGLDGFYCPLTIHGGIDTCTITMIIRDFAIQEVRRRIDSVRVLAQSIKACFPGSNVVVKEKKQYQNMNELLQTVPDFTKIMLDAVAMSGADAEECAIRGGSDASLLCEKGLPTINIFSGAQAMHSRYEWIAVRSMVHSITSLLYFLRLWSEYYRS